MGVLGSPAGFAWVSWVRLSWVRLTAAVVSFLLVDRQANQLLIGLAAELGHHGSESVGVLGSRTGLAKYGCPGFAVPGSPGSGSPRRVHHSTTIRR